MPMFDFLCPSCQNQFEELIFGDDKALCPKCGEQNVERMISAPSPLKTGAFPYKVGPVHPLVSKPQQATASSCPASCAGSCSTNSSSLNLGVK